MSADKADQTGESPIKNLQGKKAYTSIWAWARFLIPAAVGLGLDLWVKAYSFPDGVPADPIMAPYAGINPSTKEPLAIIPGILGMTTTINHGAVFGKFQGYVSVFLAFSVLAMAVILWVFASSGTKHRVVHIALGLITAGALGNLYDRAVYHGVRDMLRFLCMRFSPLHIFGTQFPSGQLDIDGKLDWYPYIFNVADALLCIGVPLLIVRWLFVKDDEGKDVPAGSGVVET